jgi:hypothetical protein
LFSRKCLDTDSAEEPQEYTVNAFILINIALLKRKTKKFGVKHVLIKIIYLPSS